MAKEYRALTGLNYPDPARPGQEKRVERGDMLSDAPKHGTGRCDSSCAMRGDHDWLLSGGVLEEVSDTFVVVPEPKEE